MTVKGRSTAGVAQDLTESISTYRWHICGAIIISLAGIYLATERYWLHLEQRELAAKIASGEGVRVNFPSLDKYNHDLPIFLTPIT